MNRNRLWRDAPSVHLHPAVIIGCPPGTLRHSTPQDVAFASHASLHEPGHQPSGDEIIKELGGDPLITALRTLYILLGAPDQLIDPANNAPARNRLANNLVLSNHPSCHHPSKDQGSSSRLPMSKAQSCARRVAS